MKKLATFELLVEGVGRAWKFEEEEAKKKKNEGREVS